MTEFIDERKAEEIYETALCQLVDNQSLSIDSVVQGALSAAQLQRGEKVTLLVEDLALLCELLSRYFAVCPEDMMGLIGSCFSKVWGTGYKQAGSTLKFLHAVQKASRQVGRRRFGADSRAEGEV